MKLLISLLILWTGEAWRSMTRTEIVSRAQEMINVSWRPANNQRSWYGDVVYYAGTTYYGVLYSQNNPQENATEFKNGIQSAPAYYGYWSNSRWYNYYGNDCSGYVSICWAMPSRYTTYTFDQHAINYGTYCYYIGATGSAGTADLRQGDALNYPSSHIILFNRRVTNGIEAMEQTPNKATYRTWYYSSLGSYRPLRRANITESTPRVTLSSYPTQVTAGSSFSISFTTQYCPTPYDVFVEVKDYSSGTILTSKKLSSVSSNGTYTVSDLVCPVRSSNYYVYILVTVTPPGGSWANRYCDVSNYSNPTLVVNPNPTVSITSYPTSVYAGSSFSITVKTDYVPTPFDMFVEIKDYSSGSTISTRKYSSVSSNGTYQVTGLTCPTRTSNYYVYFLVTVTPPGGNWSNRYTYTSTYNNRTLVIVSKNLYSYGEIPVIEETIEEFPGDALLQVDEPTEEDKIKLHATFRNGILYIQGVETDMNCEIIDIMGRPIIKTRIENGKINTGTLSRGIYFLRLENSYNTIVKFIIQ
ncbi:MAG: T9SS type A sorting domain-containing protein [candidate division WOR-3 bacterium]